MALGVHLPVQSYDSVSLAVDVSGEHALWCWLVRGLDETWDTRGDDIIIPGAHGRTPATRKRDTLVIELQGVIAGVGATPALQLASVRTRLTTLRSTFDPTKSPANLVVLLEAGNTATIACRPVNILMLDYPHPVYRPFSVELLAVGSDWAIS